jgi:hypothetical protein
LNFYQNFGKKIYIFTPFLEEYADFNSNKATYSRFLRDLERIKEVSTKKTYYFKS